MTDYTSNFMSNASRMIGFTDGYNSIITEELEKLVNKSKLDNSDLGTLRYLVKRLKKNQQILNLWWEKRGEEVPTVEQLETEINAKDIVELERA